MSLKHNFIFAGRGLRYAFKEPIFRIHTLAAVCVIGLSFALGISTLELIVVFVLVGWMISLEIVNTIIEHIIDLLKPEFHEHAKVLKDLASGAVLVSSIVAAIAGVLIFAPKLYRLFFVIGDRLAS